MSKETEPVRTRRELREASSEQTQGAAGYPPVPFVPAPSTPAADRRGRRTQPSGPAGPANGPAAPGGSPAGNSSPDDSSGNDAPTSDAGTLVPRERSSQTRARDRAALRAYKELVDSAQAEVNPLPSRRALRQAQLDAERAPVTSINPVVPPAVAGPVPPAVTPTAPAGAARPAASSKSNPARTSPVAAPASRTAPAAAPPSGAAVPARPGAAPQSKSEPQSKTEPKTATPDSGHRGRVGRRATAAAPDALPVTAAASAAPTTGPSATGPGAGHAAAHSSTTGALPQASVPATAPGGPYPSNSVGPVPSGGKPPSTEELRLLAGQRAQEDRAAVLDQRAQARDRLAQESAKSRRTAADPTATNNLAMVTPLEFVDVPGVERPVMRPPSTTHVPIVTRSTPKVSPSRRGPGKASEKATSGKASSAKPATPRDANAERFDAALAARAVHRPGPGPRPLTGGGHSGTLQRAEAMVAVAPPRAPAQPESAARTQMPPMPADYAHGLEPLDAVTAGLGRTKRNLLIQWGSIILGGAALVVGAVMFITAIAR